jgi:protein-disulfide isomerase
MKPLWSAIFSVRTFHWALEAKKKQEKKEWEEKAAAAAKAEKEAENNE